MEIFFGLFFLIGGLVIRSASQNGMHRKKPGRAGHDNKEDVINEFA